MILFFDLDGPILDVSEKYYQAYADSLKILGCSFLEKDKYWQMKRATIPDYEILKRTSGEIYLDDYKVMRNSLIERESYLAFDRIWMELRDVYDILFQEFTAVLVTLRTHEDKLHGQLDGLGISRWFDKVIVGDNRCAEKWKSKVDAILASRVLNCEKTEDCLFVGDTETDILAGKSLGMKTAGVTFGIRNRDILLQTKPDLIFDTPDELSGYLNNEFIYTRRRGDEKEKG